MGQLALRFTAGRGTGGGWLGRTLPIVFHWVLASFIILFGRFHRARLRERERDGG